MRRLAALGFTVLCACKGSDAPPAKTADKPATQPSDALAISADAAATAKPGLPMPKAKRGFIAYTKLGDPRAETPVPHFLWLADPDGGAPINTSIEYVHRAVGGHHILSGASPGTAQKFGGYWFLDLRASELVAKPTPDGFDFVTPDDRVGWRCSGGTSRPFEICISDPDGSNKKVLFSEAANKEDPAVVTAAGRAVIHARYSSGPKPPFSIAIADGKRTDYPAIIKTPKEGPQITLFYSPSGAKAASCEERITVTTFDGSIKPRTISLPGTPTRCACRFSNDDNLLACSILQKRGTEDLAVWNLSTGVQTNIAKDISIAEFAIAPDATELAYVTGNTDKGQRLEVSSIDGKTHRVLDTLEKGANFLELVTWTAPN